MLSGQTFLSFQQKLRFLELYCFSSSQPHQNGKRDVLVNQKFFDSKILRILASKIFGYNHSHVHDTVRICHRGEVLNSIRRQALKCSVENCIEC